MSNFRSSCNLSDEAFAARRKELREGLMPLARGREDLPDGLAVFFDATEQMREELAAFVDFETQCCPGLEFSVHDAPGALRLEIHGIDPNAGVFAGVASGGVPGGDTKQAASASRHDPQASPKRSGLQRALRAMGLGGAASLLVCCAIPIGITALIDSKFAAPFLALDSPWVISFGTIGFASLLWLRESRRARASEARETAEGCGC
jgi:hypothetical protein